MKITKKGFAFLCSILVFIFMLSSTAVLAVSGNVWNTMGSMEIPRMEPQLAVLNGNIYIIGGYGGFSGTGLNSVEQFDPAANVWTTKAPLNNVRYGHRTIVLNGKIYAIGGTNSSSVEQYDPAKNTWVYKRSMAVGRSDHELAVVNGKIYAIGGVDAVTALNSVEEYDPETDTWTTKAPLINARYHHRTAVINGKIYAIGGVARNNVLSSVEEYDPATNTWTVKAQMHTPRYYQGIEVIGGKIFVIGGRNIDNSLSSVEVYDPASDTWTEKASLSTPRTYFETVEADGKIYALGGSNVNTLNSVEEYNPATNVWTNMAPMANGRFGHGAAVINGKIYAVGGYNGSNYLSSVEEYTPEITIPEKPANINAAAAYKKVSLSWTAVNDAKSYNIKRADTAGGPFITIANVLENTYTDTNVSDGTYYYSVSAVNEAGEGTNSDVASATVVNSSVSFEIISQDTARMGDEISANLVIYNASNICAEDIKISFDTSKLQFISAQCADGMKIYKEDDIAAGVKRYIAACMGKENAANGDKVLMVLKFKAIEIGEAKIDIISGHIADNATLEVDVDAENCGEKTVLIENSLVRDVDRTGEFTLLDLAIDAWYYGGTAADTDTSKYDADQVINGIIDDSDLYEIITQLLKNPYYSANNL